MLYEGSYNELISSAVMRERKVVFGLLYGLGSCVLHREKLYIDDIWTSFIYHQFNFDLPII